MNEVEQVASRPELTTIHLVGSLGRAIGYRKLTMDVHSPAEAIRALDIVTKGKVSEYLTGPGARRYYKVAVQRKDCVLNKDEITHRSGRADIWFIPTIRGNDDSFEKVLVGIALIALSFTPLGPIAIGATGLKVGALLVTYGVAFVLGGIAQALTPTPQSPTRGEQDGRGSSIFQGNAATVVQGQAIPVVYGRILVPALPVSISVDNNDVSITSAGDLGEVDTFPIDGGGVQFVHD